jgi:Nucleotidyltransferase domain
MDRDEIITKLKAAEPQLRAHGVGALYLFGSYARDEARPDLDVDVFVDPGTQDFYSLNHFAGAYEVSGKQFRAGKSATARATACPSTSGPRSKRRRFESADGRDQIPI